MNFNTPSFALFMLCVGVFYVVAQCLKLPRFQKVVLLAASYYFYGSWDPQFLTLILISTAIDFCCGLGIDDQQPTRNQHVGLFVALTVFSGLLTAPINWSSIVTGYLPLSAFDGGWGVEPGTTGVSAGSLISGSWRNCAACLSAAAAILSTTAFGFTLTGATRRRFFLWFSLVSNLALLGFFKYCDFFVESFGTLTGCDTSGSVLGIIVPVGISFYTFQTLSYTIDIYRGEMKPTRNLLDFALFVSFFPQLVAGPIERASVLLPQLAERRKLDWQGIQVGSWLVGWGLFKKIFIADNLARFVNEAYAPGVNPEGPLVLFATYAFAFQIYCDFSGYTDIARGISRMMGVELMVNFNIPYAATNPQSFWRRWHISLSTWLRDYLYVSLGGNRGTGAFIYRNLMLTMFLGGLWHGARSNFVWWGLYQGALLCGHRLLEPTLQRISPRGGFGKSATRFFCWASFMHLMCYGWLLFRVDSSEQLVQMTTALSHGWESWTQHAGLLARILWFAWPLMIVQFFQYRSRNLLVVLTWPWAIRWACYVGMFYLTVIFGAFDVVEFIYFQF